MTVNDVQNGDRDKKLSLYKKDVLLNKHKSFIKLTKFDI